MNILKNKKGMGLPMVLGITVFVIGLSATLMSYIVFQSRIVEYDIEESETYHNAVSDVSTALNYLSQNPEMTDAEILSLSNYLNVVIEQNENGLYIITSLINETNEVVSYMTGSTQITDIDDIIFDFDGTEETFELSPVITSETLLSDYMPDYVIDSLNISNAPEDLNTYDDVMNYMEDLANDGIIDEMSSSEIEKMKTAVVTDNTYIDGDVDLKRDRDLIVSDGSILFIDGDLNLQRDTLVYGNIIVNGDVEIERNDIQIVATLYIQGDLVISNNLELGTIDRPTFIFVTGNVEIKNNVSGYAYIVAENIEMGNNINIIGGIYTHQSFDYGENVYIEENLSLDVSKLYDYAVPTQITTETDNPDGTSDSEIVFTYPKLK
ncbi:hypothetical protein BK011_04525 [Tenericutes bacterium MZ-XQ]|nr:hypothetical protein BK011_04525 [Tenericutes bacterium MZ-XQ]